jgi:hypothetical protein
MPGIHLCHACHNSKCSNPYHLYWGTVRENNIDRIANGAFGSPFEALVAKIGYEEACKVNGRNFDASKAGRGNRGKPKTAEHRAKISASLRDRKKIT